MTDTSPDGEPLAMRLDLFENRTFDRGRSRFVEAVWLVVSGLCVSSGIPGTALRRSILRLFGATIGTGVVIKPRVRIKFPWRLTIGDHAWIGEGVWIDNLAPVSLGAHSCVSQGSYLCTGSHDRTRETFDLFTAPIAIEAGAWIAARAVVGPGIRVGRGAVLTLGAVATRDLEADTVYGGNPAAPMRRRSPTVAGGATGSAEAAGADRHACRESSRS